MITKEYICLKMKLGLIFIFINLFIPHAVITLLWVCITKIWNDYFVSVSCQVISGVTLGFCFHYMLSEMKKSRLHLLGGNGVYASTEPWNRAMENQEKWTRQSCLQGYDWHKTWMMAKPLYRSKWWSNWWWMVVVLETQKW